MTNCEFPYKNSIIGYCRFGNGPHPVICFHGYGEEASSFAFLEKYAGDQFSFFSIDLPYHGRTVWNEGLVFTHRDLEKIVSGILAKEPAGQKLTLVGFSLGGRIALSLYQCIPANVERIVLLAPDGLKINFWYWLSTQTWLGNKLFAFTMKHPGWFFGFLKGINKLGFVNASIFKFVNYYIGDAGIRLLLYERWTSLRKLRPHLHRIRTFIQKHKTLIRLIYGRHDRIILPVRGDNFRKGIEEQSSIKIISSGHQVLQEAHITEIMEALLH